MRINDWKRRFLRGLASARLPEQGARRQGHRGKRTDKFASSQPINHDISRGGSTLALAPDALPVN